MKIYKTLEISANEALNGTTALNMFALLLIGLTLVFVIDRLAKVVLVKLFSKFAERSKTNFDDLLVKNKVPRNLGHIFPLLVALELTPYIFVDFQSFERIEARGWLIEKYD